MPSAEKEAAPLDFVVFLGRLTKKKRWVLLEQQDNGTGVDYWYTHADTTAYINLDENNAVPIDILPSTDFKTCSKFAHRFVNPVSDSIFLNKAESDMT